MASVFAEKSSFQESHLAQEPRQQRQLKHSPHHKDEHKEIVHIRVERHHGLDLRAQLVGGQEAQGQREHDEIPHGHAKVEHQVAEKKGLVDAALFMVVKSGRDEAPEQVDHHRKAQNQGHPARGRHMDEKLRRQLETDGMELERSRREVAGQQAVLAQEVHQAVEREVGAAGREHHVVEHPWHHAKRANPQGRNHNGYTHQDAPQSVEMVPEGGFLCCGGHYCLASSFSASSIVASTGLLISSFASASPCLKA